MSTGYLHSSGTHRDGSKYILSILCGKVGSGKLLLLVSVSNRVAKVMVMLSINLSFVPNPNFNSNPTPPAGNYCC
jgi:hypothetical protein